MVICCLVSLSVVRPGYGTLIDVFTVSHLLTCVRVCESISHRSSHAGHDLKMGTCGDSPTALEAGPSPTHPHTLTHTFSHTEPFILSQATVDT